MILISLSILFFMMLLFVFVRFLFLVMLFLISLFIPIFMMFMMFFIISVLALASALESLVLLSEASELGGRIVVLISPGFTVLLLNCRNSWCSSRMVKLSRYPLLICTLLYVLFIILLAFLCQPTLFHVCRIF